MNPYDTTDSGPRVSTCVGHSCDNGGALSKTAPAGNRGLTSAGTSRQEALVTIMHRESDNTTQGAH